MCTVTCKCKRRKTRRRKLIAKRMSEFKNNKYIRKLRAKGIFVLEED